MVRDNTYPHRRSILKGAGAATVAALAGCMGDDDSGDGFRPIELEEWPPEHGDSLNVWNWYFDFRDWAAETFAEEYDIENMNTAGYSDPSEWYSQLEGGNGEIDSIGSSVDWTVRGMDNEYIEPLPVDIMPVWDEIPESLKEILDEYHTVDGDVYALPQALSVNPSLTYNTEVFESPPDSWGILWDDEFEDEVFMWDRSYYACQIAALYTGQDPFEPDDMDEIREVLIQQRDLNVTYWDEFNHARGMFINEDVVAGPLLDGQTFIAKFDDEAPIDYTVPEEGTLYGMNDFVLPTNAPNPRTALLFIDWIARPENIKHMMTEIGYRPPVDDDDLMDLYEDELADGTLTEEQIEFHIWPEEWNDRLYFERPLDDEVLQRFDEIWTEVKSA